MPLNGIWIKVYGVETKLNNKILLHISVCRRRHCLKRKNFLRKEFLLFVFHEITAETVRFMALLYCTCGSADCGLYRIEWLSAVCLFINIPHTHTHINISKTWRTANDKASKAAAKFKAQTDWLSSIGVIMLLKLNYIRLCSDLMWANVARTLNFLFNF